MEEKVSLPIKTKIAAWWMRKLGGFSIWLGILQLVIIIFLLFLGFGRMNYPAPFGLWVFARLTSFGTPPFVSMFDFASPTTYWEDYFEPIPIYFISGILLTIFSRSLFKKKKWAWISSVVLLLIIWLLPTLFFILFVPLDIIYYGAPRVIYWDEVIGGLVHWFFFGPILYGRVFIFLLLDRKNFWKVAT